MVSISVIIPCFNEANYLEKIIQKVVNSGVDIKEIIIVDDCSTDNSRNIIKNILKNNKNIIAFFHDKNSGKGAALKTGFKNATGEIILIQDADLEYDPKDYKKLIEPFRSGEADVVYGSRFKGGEYVRLHFFYHSIANKLLTLICNFVTNLNMSDMETGYKLFKKSFLTKFTLKENSFGIEPELTIKLAKSGAIFYEVPISYKGRSYKEGKKIKLRDAFIALFCIFYYAIKK